MNRYYQPHLNEEPYLGILKKQHAGPVVITGDSLHAVMMARFGSGGVDCEYPWECFSKDKIILSVSGEAITNNSVRVTEVYSYNELSQWRTKLFSYREGQWTYTIVDEQ